MSTCLVGGASRGIGLEVCRQLVARGEQVIATCRRADAALESVGATVIDDVDVGDAASVARLVDAA